MPEGSQTKNDLVFILSEKSVDHDRIKATQEKAGIEIKRGIIRPGLCPKPDNPKVTFDQIVFDWTSVNDAYLRSKGLGFNDLLQMLLGFATGYAENEKGPILTPGG